MAEVDKRGQTSKGIQPSEAHLPKYLRKGKYKSGDEVKRAAGAGAKSTMEFLFPCVQLWFTDLRSNGQTVLKSDLVIEFKRVCELFVEKMRLKEEDVGLSVSETKRLSDIELRLKTMQKLDSKRYIADTLQRFLGARHLRPQRVIAISMDKVLSKNASCVLSRLR